MDTQGIAQGVAQVLKHEPDFDKCLRFALSMADGLKIINSTNEEDFILELSKYDNRFLEGFTVDRIIIPNNKLNPSGALYVGKSIIAEARQKGHYAVVTIRGKGL